MKFLNGIIALVIGIVLILLSVGNIIPGLTGTGAAFSALGILLIGLSFIPKPVTDDTGKMPVLETLTAIFYAPSAVFANLRRHPRWFAAVLVITVFSGVYTYLFQTRMTPERITNYTIDKTLDMPMVQNNESARVQIEKGRAKAIEEAKNPILRAANFVSGFAKYTLFFAFFAAIFLVFLLALGSKINYWQALSIAAYAALPIMVLRYLLSSVILFIKDPTDIHPIIGQGSLVQDNLSFLVNPAQNPISYTLLAGFSLLAFYGIYLNYTGLKNGGEKVTATSAWTVSISLWVIGLLLSVLLTFLFPSFLS